MSDQTLDDEIEAVVNRVRDFHQDAEELSQKIYALKDRLGTLLEQRGTSWSDDDGYARAVGPEVRVNYNTDALDALIINDPLRYGWLSAYRKHTTLAGRVLVK